MPVSRDVKGHPMVRSFRCLPSGLGEKISSDAQEQRNVVAGELWQIDLRQNSENSESNGREGASVVLSFFSV